jgi:DNA-directed RNA polymerase specialized sigma24 family protein
VLTLRYLEQCNVAQAAYRIGWSQMRVRVQTHRAIAKLKKLSAALQLELEL